MRKFFGGLRALLAKFTNILLNENSPDDELRRKVDERMLETVQEYVGHHEVVNQLYIALVRATGSDRVATQVICCFAGFLTPSGLTLFVLELVNLKSEKDVLYFYNVWRFSRDVTKQSLRNASISEPEDFGKELDDPEIFMERIRIYARNRALELSKSDRQLIGQFFPMT